MRRIVDRLLRNTAVPLVVSALSALVLAACSNTTTGSDSDGAVVGDPFDLAGVSSSGYPAGPYGSEPGSVLPNFAFQGYWSPTKTSGSAKEEPFGEVTFDRLRTSGAKFAIIQLAAFW